MLATAIIGSTVGVKKARRKKPRPRMLRLTQIAISRASAIEVGMVPSANQKLLTNARQKIGSAAIAWELSRPTKASVPLRRVMKKECRIVAKIGKCVNAISSTAAGNSSSQAFTAFRHACDLRRPAQEG